MIAPWPAAALELGETKMPAEDNFFIERCLSLEDGDVARHDNFSVHRYADGWWLLLAEPKPGNLGTLYTSREELVKCLTGRPALGRVIGGWSLDA